MTLISPDVPLSLTASKIPKEMISLIRMPDGRVNVRINFSSLDLIQTCLRKAEYALVRKMRSTLESPATLFGSAVHAALEVWYSSPRRDRPKTATKFCDDSQALMLVGQTPLAHECVRCASAYAFLTKAEPLAALPESDKRSRANGLDILANYFDHYADDPFIVLRDESGPLVERRFDYVLHEDSNHVITYFGTIDVVLVNEETGTTLICDHKTTATIGSEFLNRLKPNFQYIGYVAGGQRTLGLTTSAFMVNGIQVAKNVRGLSRQVIQFNPDDFDEHKLAVEHAVDEYLGATSSLRFPQNSPNPCSMYGGCQYRKICEVPKSLRENVIAAFFNNPTEGDET